MLDLPLFLVDFLKRNNISPEEYGKLVNQQKSPRYICINPLNPISLQELQTQLDFELLKSFPLYPVLYEIDPSIKLAGLPCFKNGQILSVDIASAIAVQALELAPTDHYLDLCCAPGAKLCMAGMIMQSYDQHSVTFDSNDLGSVTGVDISKNRLSICRSLVKKYKLGQTRLFCMDGKLFNIAVARLNETISVQNKPFYTSTMYRRHQFSVSAPIRDCSGLYTKILVDAECTHDGSIKHIIKMIDQRNYVDHESYFQSDHEIRLRESQFQLLKHAFSLLKTNGLLVYSTCSLTEAQNSQIITRFFRYLLDNNLINTCTLLNPFSDTAEIVRGTRRVPIEIRNESKSIFLGHCIAFDPSLSCRASGFFIAKLKKQ